ncbi:Uncharacterized protein TCM_007247 [Theobroma cacao]|uniref:Uncharacterized protein n=1 Tax=Theobroma cacao TaxID=3641 RepID=A0A061E1I5_THECC|nr:Uncharacterized protein TCM_007247 [Theobroma cacao]
MRFLGVSRSSFFLGGSLLAYSNLSRLVFYMFLSIALFTLERLAKCNNLSFCLFLFFVSFLHFCWLSCFYHYLSCLGLLIIFPWLEIEARSQHKTTTYS